LASRKTFEVVRTLEAERDLDALFDFLLASYVHFGDSVESAFVRASQRLERVKADLHGLGKIPKQGTLRPEMMPGLRSVTKDRAVFYFVVDDERRLVRLLAVFFGGQDHQGEMLKRLLGK
jgi:toxin ParE1/3/4